MISDQLIAACDINRFLTAKPTPVPPALAPLRGYDSRPNKPRIRDSQSGPERQLPSLRLVAQLAGVSAMTASRALANRPRVATVTRDAVLKVATELGYRPDPQVAKLMHHLRTRRKPVFQGSICALTNRTPDMEHEYCEAVVQGAQERAAALGFGFKLINLATTTRPRELLARILRDQGIDGVLLLPMACQMDCSELLDWREFSAVAATLSVERPAIHRVTPAHFANMQLVCDHLAQRGYRRIGLVTEAAQDARVKHAFSAAMLSHNQQTDAAVPALIHHGSQPEGLSAWFKKHAPDAIVTTASHKCGQIVRCLGPEICTKIALVSTSISPGSAWGGIDEFPGEIGAVAVETLASMIYRGFKGMPTRPAMMMIEGAWKNGRAGHAIGAVRGTLAGSPA